MIDDSGRSGRPVGDYFRVIRRGWWIVLATVVLVTVATYAISARQAPKFQASASDLISAQNILLGSTSRSSSQSSSKDALFYAATQAALANNPQIAAAALKDAGITDMTPQGLLKNSTVTADPTASIVTFTVSYHTRKGAMRLANAYATAFAAQSKADLTSQIDKINKNNQKTLKRLNGELTTVELRIQSARNSGTKPSFSDNTQAQSLQKQIQQTQEDIDSLRNAESLGFGGTKLATPAGSAAQLAPNTKRNTIVGVILGIVLGVGLVFAREAFDTRIRSAEEVAGALGLPLFGRLPRPDKDLRKRDQLALMADPNGTDSEAYRKLRVSLDFANLDPRAQMLLVTSAVAQEGKSTTAANLAVAMAGAGRRVILVDLDLRQPYLDRFFGLTGRPGLTDVILGTAELDDALAPVVVPGGVEPEPRRNGHGPTHSGALLHVLIAGDPPSDPSSLLVSQPLAALLTELRSRADMVVIDTPPVLPVADTMGLTSLADGYLVVSRLDLVRRPMVHELRRELASARAVGLGVVVTDAEAEAGYGYGGTYGGYSYGAPADQPTRARADR